MYFTLEKYFKLYCTFVPLSYLYLQNYNPKLSDFGLAKLWPSSDKTHVTTRMMGTGGYVAPEYLVKGNYILSMET